MSTRLARIKERIPPILVVNTPIFENYSKIVKYALKEFSNTFVYIVKTVLYTLSWVTRPIYILLLTIGVFLYFSRLSKWKGKDLIVGSVILAIFSEFILPFLINYLNSITPP